MESTETTTVYYDGACPICTREIGLYRRCAGAERVDWVDVAARDAGSAAAPDLPRADALARFHVRGPDGALVSGAAAFATLWRALPAWRWLGRLAAVPPVTAVLELCYRAFLVVRRVARRS
jgi:predicted DCC family thiol-disulfide oxidoreductase YuxK